MKKETVREYSVEENMTQGMRSNDAASKKHHILQGLPLTNSKHFYKNHNVRRNSIILGCLLYICKFKLKLRLEAVRREYMKLMALKKQYLCLLENAATDPKVMVKKVGIGYYEVKVSCERKEDMLVSTLEAFESVGLDVLQARVSSEDWFSMDAFAVAQDQRDVDASVITQAILKSFERHDY